MSTQESAIRIPQSSMGHVTVEVVAWVTRFVGGDGTRRQVFQEPVTPGASVRSVLGQVSDRHPALREALWDATGRDLSEHIEVLVNDAVLGVAHSLDSPVRDGDRITLIGQYSGGSSDRPRHPSRAMTAPGARSCVRVPSGEPSPSPFSPHEAPAIHDPRSRA